MKISEEKKKKVELLKTIMDDNSPRHFLVIHLSNVETVKDTNGREVYKQYMNLFVNEVIGDEKNSNKQYRYVVFTSGRNRKVETKGFNTYQKSHTFFIHREEFLQIFEWANQIPIEAAFRIKYGIVKLLVGT